MRIFVGGSLQNVPRDPELCRQFVVALGAEVVMRGHVLLNGSRSSLDKAVATAASEWLANNAGDPKSRIISYCLKDDKPIHSLGTVRYSALSDWQMNHSELDIPEQISLAGATIFIAGSEGTYWAKNWAALARKPILGIPRFGGAGEAIYSKQLKQLRELSPALAEDYEALNSLSEDMPGYAKEVVRLVERMVTPRSVFAVMSFKSKYRGVFASYKSVCQEFEFDAERTDESTSLERIIPRIESGIRKSAFVLADISEPSPNVFYELGYAKGLGKDVIVSVKKGAEVPFDVGDVPTIRWSGQEDLREGLRRYIADLTVKYGR